MVAAQVNLSYTGTLEQWQAMLHRTAFLPEALSAVKLTQTLDWTFATPRFVSSVPSSVLTLTAKSPLTLTMGFIHDGERTRWDVEEVWWSKSNRHDEEVGVWRRPQPRPSAKLELRNRFGTILARRAPYDGTLNRETSEVYAASRVLDVRGATAGSVSSDLLYGVTLRTAGLPKESDTDVSLRSLTKLTRILETGNGEGKTPDLVSISSAGNDSAALIQQRDAFEQAMRVWADHGGPKGKDLRGRELKDDVNEFIRDLNSAATPDLAAKNPAAFREQMSKEALKLKLLGEYWQESLAIVHSREIWLEFLRRNHLPETRPHSPEVIAAERVLLGELNATTPKIVWAARAKELHAVYLKERAQIAAALQPVIDSSNLTPRTDPCPPPATTNTGNNKPKVIGSSKSAEDYWPMESKRLGEEGNVVAGLKISATGCVIAKEIVVSSGSDMLDRAALEFVETIEFVPAAIDGKAVEATTPMRIIFKLRD